MATVTSTGQWDAGALSKANTRDTTSTTAIKIISQYGTTTSAETIIPLSEKFAQKSLDAGIPISRTASGTAYVSTTAKLPVGVYNQQGDYLGWSGTLATAEQGAIIQRTPEIKTGGLSLTPLLLIGGALLLLK